MNNNSESFFCIDKIHIWNSPMNPAGKLASVRTFPSTLINRCMTILVTSGFDKAYFSRLRKKMTNGRDSRSLCGPWDGRGAKVPPNLSNIHAFGACKRFKCFLGPRAYNPEKKHAFLIRIKNTQELNLSISQIVT